MRRLVPALGLVVVVTLIASAFVLSPLELARVSRDGLMSVSYTSNIGFAIDGSDYFAEDRTGSLFLHTWSLGVEEQFYLLWPWLCIGVARLARRRRRRGAVHWLVWSGLVVASFALAVRLTSDGSAWGFFGLPSRAWEFGVGALLTTSAVSSLRSSTRAGTALQAVAVAALVASMVWFDGATPHPGWATTIPVLGAALVIASGSWAPGAPGVLGSRVLGYLGQISYAWYLWHWPAILLAVAAFGASTTTRLVAAVVAIGLADVTRRWVEDPIRFHPSLRASARSTFAVGLLVSLVAVLGTVGLDRYATDAGDTLFFHALSAAKADTARAAVDPMCRDEVSPGGVPYCELGDPTGEPLMLVGDSHAAHWAPGLEAVTSELGLRLIVRTTGGCPAAPVTVSGFAVRGVALAKCDEYREATSHLVDELDPVGVVVSARSGEDRVLEGTGGIASTATAARLWEEAAVSLAEALRARGVSIGVILDTPTYSLDPIVCAGRDGSFADCGVDRSDALGPIEPFRDAERRAIGGAGGIVFDPIDLVCSPSRCDPEQDGVVRYSDATHLTASFVRSMEPQLRQLVEAVVLSSAGVAR